MAATAVASATQAAAPLAAVASEEFRCRSCRRLLAKLSPEALRPGRTLEIKCGSCNTRSYIVGTDD